MEQLSLRDLIGYWDFHNRTEGKSPNTIRWYNHELGKLERFPRRPPGDAAGQHRLENS